MTTGSRARTHTNTSPAPDLVLVGTDQGLKTLFNTSACLATVVLVQFTLLGCGLVTNCLCSSVPSVLLSASAVTQVVLVPVAVIFRASRRSASARASQTWKRCQGKVQIAPGWFPCGGSDAGASLGWCFHPPSGEEVGFGGGLFGCFALLYSLFLSLFPLSLFFFYLFLLSFECPFRRM